MAILLISFNLIACNTDVTVDTPKATETDLIAVYNYITNTLSNDPDYLAVRAFVNGGVDGIFQQGSITGTRKTQLETGYIERSYIIGSTIFYPSTTIASISGSISVKGTYKEVYNGALTVEDTFDGEIFGNLINTSSNLKVTAGKVKWSKLEDGSYYFNYRDTEITFSD